jgi:medium-chain acyl-[acyl-carrier-protein] hydrolase
MGETFTLESAVSYWDVDRDQCLTLGGVFKLLQEAAIKHADRYDLGSRAMATHGATWVLNRVAATIARYPRYEEKVTVRTWSAGIRGFRGYRDLRVFSGDELLLSASTLWIYVDLRTKSLARVPEDLASRFPVGTAEVHRPDLEKMRLGPPAAGAPVTEVSLRYGDFDGNAHLNNTAYLDALQTALSRQGRPVRPRELEVQFLKEVPPTAPAIGVALGDESDGTRVAWMSGNELHAQGTVRF